jgi:hypothetical protein
LVIGGVAASILGRPRLTNDVDVLVVVETSQWPDLFASAADFQLSPRVSDPMAFANRTRVLPLRHEPSQVDVDLVLGSLAFEEEALARARPVTLDELSIPLPTPEDLIVMKMVAHRPQDLIDAETVLEVQQRLDLGRIRRWLGEFGAALDTAELVDDFEAMLARRRRRRRH